MSKDQGPGTAMNIDQIQSILGAEIECGVFESVVVPALDVCRKVAASSAATVSDAARVGLIEHIINAAVDCIRHDVSPDWQRSALRNRLNAIFAATAGAQDERAHPFAALCDLLPSEVSWGDSLTPRIVRHIARAASSVTEPKP